MAAIKVRAKRACFTAEQRYAEAGDEFVWFGDPEELPDYLEALAAPTHAAPPPVKTLTPEQRAAAIIDIVSSFDHGDDALWTNEGEPRIEAIHAAFGDESVTRAEVRNVAPEAVRSK